MHFTGERYDPALSRVEIGKRMRAEIKKQITEGTLPAGLKVSITTQNYAGGGAIDLEITALPADFPLHNQARTRDPETEYDYYHRLPDDHPERPRYDPRAAALLAQLREIHQLWCRDRSDMQTDYHECNYYGSWTFSSEIERARWTAQTPA